MKEHCTNRSPFFDNFPNTKIYNESGVRITWSQALIRNITKVDIFLLLLELLIARYKNQHYQRLLDSLAQTIVVRKGK